MQTPADRLWLAGDWTDTGLPATLEGAIDSGHRVARAEGEQGPPVFEIGQGVVVLGGQGAGQFGALLHRHRRHGDARR